MVTKGKRAGEKWVNIAFRDAAAAAAAFRDLSIISFMLMVLVDATEFRPAILYTLPIISKELFTIF